MAYELGETLSPDVAGGVANYMRTGEEGYDEDMARLRGQAMTELQAELTSGDVQGQLGEYEEAALGQSFDDEAQRFRSGLSLRAADVGEENRARLQGRGFDVEDRDRRLERLRRIARDKRDEAHQQGEAGMWGGIGTAVGGLVGAYFGGAGGAGAGSKIGGAVASGGKGA